MALISPAAENYLEEMAQLSHQLTQKRFGKQFSFMLLCTYNECRISSNIIVASVLTIISRKTLTDDEILKRDFHYQSNGYDHILLVTGEDNKHVGVEYLSMLLKLFASVLSHIFYRSSATGAKANMKS